MEPLLDGKAPASASPQPSCEPRRGASDSPGTRDPSARVRGPSAVLVEPRSAAPPRYAFRPRCFRPWAGLATLPLTPFLATLRGLGPSPSGRIASPSPRIAVPAPLPPRQRSQPFAGPGRLPSPSAPSPLSHVPLSRFARGITRSPPPVSLLACSWLSPPRPGFRRPFAPGAPRKGSHGARPETFRPGPSAARRLLQPPQPASTTA